VNYFEFYNIPVSFFPDLAKIKQAYFQKSRESHPDFFTNATEEEQSNALQQSSFNNTAYKILSEFQSRFKYILELENLIDTEQKEQMPPEFLMQMMDFNEEVMDLQIEFDRDKFVKLKLQLETFQKSLEKSIQTLFEAYPQINLEEKKELKHYYFKNKYVNRLLNNIMSLNQNS